MNNHLYSLCEINSETDIKIEYYDYLIIAPNIEDRSREFYKKYCCKKIYKNLVLVDYDNFHKSISENQEQNFYNDFIENDCIKIICKNESEAVKGLLDLKINKDDKVAMDITGFSIPNIYQMLYVLKNIIKLQMLDVYYTEPRFYVYNKGYYDKYHAYLNQRTCRPIEGYFNSGVDEKEILTIFLGFDGGLAKLVYSKIAEESQDVIDVYIVNGFPSYAPKLKDVSLLNNQDIITDLGKYNQIYHASAFNPFSVYNLLCTLQKKAGGKLMNICTIGSKPMALGACLFALSHIDCVKVTYPFYEKIKFDADEKAGKIWRYNCELAE
jgi:hypothetical protein